MKSVVFVTIFALIGIIVCCSFFTPKSNRYRLDDPELAPFSAMYDIDREQYCLTEIDKNAEVEIERDTYATSDYHVMLHMYGGNVSRTVAFEKQGETYVWLGEQEIHRSGRIFDTVVDGETDEKISVTYHQKKYSDFEGLRIRYLGDYWNVNFANNPFELTCEDVTPYIEAWDSQWQAANSQ